jgi:hypothetical protein
VAEVYVAEVHVAEAMGGDQEQTPTRQHSARQAHSSDP